MFLFLSIKKLYYKSFLPHSNVNSTTFQRNKTCKTIPSKILNNYIMNMDIETRHVQDKVTLVHLAPGKVTDEPMKYANSAVSQGNHKIRGTSKRTRGFK